MPYQTRVEGTSELILLGDAVKGSKDKVAFYALFF